MSAYDNIFPKLIVQWNDGFRLYCEAGCEERIVQGDDYVILPDGRSLCCRCLDECLGDVESLEGLGLREIEIPSPAVLVDPTKGDVDAKFEHAPFLE